MVAVHSIDSIVSDPDIQGGEPVIANSRVRVIDVVASHLCRGAISFAELDASVQGWINHVRYADTWGLREHVFRTHPIRPPRKP